MARDIAEGYHVVTERTFRSMTPGDLAQINQEMDRALRDTRGQQAPLDDLPAIQHRNRKIQRLNTALMILRNFRSKRRR